MLPTDPRYYMRPNGEHLTEVTVEQIRKDILATNPSIWHSEEGYAHLRHNHGIREKSYLTYGHVAEYGFFMSAVLDRLNAPALVPLTSDNFSDIAQVWNGQSFTPVPRAFFVTEEQAAEIAAFFWQTGNLSPIVRWVSPWEHGWDFTQPAESVA